jgi:1,6-anhydro-N-acetylmuramate kinase
MSDAIEQLRTRAEGRTAVGIMTGTSMDAIDAAVVRISAGRAEVLASLEHRAWICGVKFTPADDNRSRHCVKKKKKKTSSIIDQSIEIKSQRSRLGSGACC